MPNKAFERGLTPEPDNQGNNMRLSVPLRAAFGITALLGAVIAAAPDASAAVRRTAVMSGARGEAAGTPTTRTTTTHGRRNATMVSRTRHAAVVSRTRG